jgi:sulfide:quinone oxidoreductase
MLLHVAFETRGVRPRVSLSIHTAEGAPMGTAGPEMGQFIRTELASRNIAYVPQRVTTRVDPAARRVIFEDGSETPYDLLIAIPPHEAPAVARDAGLTAPSGWIPVDPATMQVILPAAEDVVYAAGDITTVPLPGRFKPDAGLVLPKAGVFAAGHGRVAAHQIAARVLGRPTDVTFDGRGYCFLEVGGRRAIRAEGEFFALPHPIMQKKAPDEAQFNDKLSWVANLLSGNRQ